VQASIERANVTESVKIKFNLFIEHASMLCSLTSYMTHTSVITREEFDRLSAQFPTVNQASYQAGTGEYFVAEWQGDKLARLVHYFSPIL